MEPIWEKTQQIPPQKPWKPEGNYASAAKTVNLECIPRNYLQE
jgi:hypothetical protein